MRELGKSFAEGQTEDTEIRVHSGNPHRQAGSIGSQFHGSVLFRSLKLHGL